jgi:putative ABC transport system ATP-binding protein
MENLIKVIDVKRKYMQGKIEVNALNGVNLTIKSGGFVVLSGPSGSGKSTLLNILGTLDKATSGQIIINNNDISQMSAHQLADFRLHNLGFIFQSYNLFPVLTALENVSLSLELKGLNKKEINEKALKVLEDVGLKDYINRKPKELSGGQQQRVAVARALVGNPSLILADEPTANLDSKNSELLIALMKDMKNKYNTTIVVSSHDNMVVEQAETIVKLKDGVIVD